MEIGAYVRTQSINQSIYLISIFERDAFRCDIFGGRFVDSFWTMHLLPRNGYRQHNFVTNSHWLALLLLKINVFIFVLTANGHRKMNSLRTEQITADNKPTQLD